MRSTIQMLLAYAKAMWSALTVGVRRSRVLGAAVVVWTAADKSATEKRKPRAILTMRQMRIKGAGTHSVYIWLLFLLYRAPCPLSRSCWFKSHRSTGTLAQRPLRSRRNRPRCRCISEQRLAHRCRSLRLRRTFTPVGPQCHFYGMAGHHPCVLQQRRASEKLH